MPWQAVCFPACFYPVLGVCACVRQALHLIRHPLNHPCPPESTFHWETPAPGLSHGTQTHVAATCCDDGHLQKTQRTARRETFHTEKGQNQALNMGRARSTSSSLGGVQISAADFVLALRAAQLGRWLSILHKFPGVEVAGSFSCSSPIHKAVAGGTWYKIFCLRRTGCQQCCGVCGVAAAALDPTRSGNPNKARFILVGRAGNF